MIDHILQSIKLDFNMEKVCIEWVKFKKLLNNFNNYKMIYSQELKKVNQEVIQLVHKMMKK